MSHNRISCNAAFTLVELAIVLTIIGLIIGGILQGQEMLMNARVVTTIQQVNSIKSAATAFQDRYGFVPGDFPFSTSRLPGCVAPLCVDGNGNGIVGDPVKDFTSPNRDDSGILTMPQVESTMFWKNLAAGGFLNGVDANGAIGSPQFGVTQPASPLGGGFGAGYHNGDAINLSPNSPIMGNLIFILGDLNPAHDLQAPEKLITPPRMAYRLDAKIDDSIPNTGFVVSEHVSTGCKDADGPLPGNYISSYADRGCLVFFFIER